MQPINVSNTTLSTYKGRRHRKFDAKQKKRHDFGKAQCVICDEVFTKYTHNTKVCSKECRKKKKTRNNRKYNEENPEKQKAYARKYREKNREKIKTEARKWREENREKEAARSRKYRKENREKTNAYGRKYYEKNREKVLARDRARYHAKKKQEEVNR